MAHAAGCEKLFKEKISGVRRNRPMLEKLLDQLRKGDILVVTRLDRLARSTSELLLSVSEDGVLLRKGT
jgi:DNA invertase Pin-like site-specific DNA recombinase